jgi:hypothetical protein
VVRTDRDAFNFGMRVLDVDVIEGEHAVEWVAEELHLSHHINWLPRENLELDFFIP